MKKFLAILLTLAMLFSLCACGAKKPANTDGSFEDDYQFTFDDTETTQSTSSAVSSTTETVSSANSSTTSSSVTSNVSSTIKVELEIPTDNRTVIACWGDSITEGMGMTDKSYPVRLQELLGTTNFVVYNGGDGGEKSNTIAARQGGLKVYTSKNITFARGKSSQSISTETNDCFVDEKGAPVVLTNALGNELSVNDVKIGDQYYSLKFEDFVWTPRSFKLCLERTGDTSSMFTIPKGTEVVFNSTEISKRGGIDIYLVGANGGYEGSATTYIEQVKAMIKHHGNDKYIIVKPYWASVAGLEEAFGDHLVDFAELAITEGLAYEGLTPTAADKTAISKKSVPASLRYNNEADNVHLNEYGYHFLAHCIHEKGKTLGYW